MPVAVAYQQQNQQGRGDWLQCKAVSKIACILVISLVVFFSLLGALYIPYKEAVDSRREAYNQAYTYVHSDVCTSQRILSQLGRVGQADCAKWAKTLELDIYREASHDVLNKLNLCKHGECVVLSFNLITFVSTFLPMLLAVFLILILFSVSCVIYSTYQSAVRNEAIPFFIVNQELNKQHAQ